MESDSSIISDEENLFYDKASNNDNDSEDSEDKSKQKKSKDSKNIKNIIIKTK